MFGLNAPDPMNESVYYKDTLTYYCMGQAIVLLYCWQCICSQHFTRLTCILVTDRHTTCTINCCRVHNSLAVYTDIPLHAYCGTYTWSTNC